MDVPSFRQAAEAASTASDPSVRTQAEQYLTTLRHADNVLAVCRGVLETSNSPLAEFHASRILCDASLEKWEGLDALARAQLRDYLFEYSLARAHTMSLAVRNKVLQAHAILWKRGWLETKREDQAAFLSKVEQQLNHSLNSAGGSAAGYSVSVVLLQTLVALLQEFSSSKSSSVGLTLEWHLQSAEEFQAHGLIHIMRLVLTVLSSFSKGLGSMGAPKVPAPMVQVLGNVLTVIVEMFSWEFIRSSERSVYFSKRRNQNADTGGRTGGGEQGSADTPPVVPVASYRSIFLSSELKTILITIYSAVRFEHEELRTLTTQALLLLASVRGEELFQSPAERLGYLSSFLLPFLQLVGVPGDGSAVFSEEQAGDAVSVSRVLSRLVSSFDTSLLAQVPNCMEVLFHLSKYTQGILRTAVQTTIKNATEEGELPDPQEPTMTAFNSLLSMWVSVVVDDAYWGAVRRDPGEAGQRMVGCVKQCVFPIFQLALEGRLQIANQLVLLGLDDDDEFEDVSALDSQMTDLGFLARVDATSALQSMRKILGSTASKLGFLQGGAAPGAQAAGNVTCILEELWWVCHFLGYVLTDDGGVEGSSEVPLIPKAVLEAAFASFVSAAGGQQASTFPLLELSQDMFAIVDFECGRIINALTAHSGNDSSLSPLLAEKLLWLTRKWARSYLMPDPSMYDPSPGVSPNILGAYGASAPPARNLVNFLVTKSCMFLAFWGYEEGVCREACKLLQDLAFRKTTREALLQQDAFLVLVQAQALAVGVGRRGKITQANSGANQAAVMLANGLKDLPNQYAEDLVFIVCRACDGFSTPSTRESNLAQVLNPIFARYHTLTGAKDFVQSSHQQPVVSLEILRLLGMFCGIAKSTTTVNHNAIFNALAPYLAGVVQLLEVYRTHDLTVKNILRFFALLTESQVEVLSPAQSLALCQACSLLFQTYARHNLGRRWAKVANKALSEEEQEELSSQIIAFLSILTHLASKGIIDFFDYDATRDEATAEMATKVVADAIVFGLQMIIPLIDRELLQFPKLCQSYFDLVTHVVESYPEKVMALEEKLFKSFMNSLEFGVAHYDATVVRSSLRAIEEYASHVAKERGLVLGHRGRQIAPQSNRLASSCLRHFLRLLFESLLFQNFLSNQVDAYSSTILSLTVCESQAFMEIAGQVLQSEQDPATKQRLTSAFEGLVRSNGVAMNRLDRPNRLKFRKNFRAFLSEARGILKKQ
jgi:hypothetical protein